MADHDDRPIRALRITKGLRGVDVAKRAGLAASTVSNLEAGRFAPSAHILARVLVAMDATDAELARVVRDFAVREAAA